MSSVRNTIIYKKMNSVLIDTLIDVKKQNYNCR